MPDKIVVEFDGERMRSVEGFFAAFVKGLCFPEYFGWNWAAFEECITDLSGSPARAYLLIIRRAEMLLMDSAVDRAIFFKLIKDVAAQWANSFGLGEKWGGGEVPFNVVLLCADSARTQIEERLTCH
ncbi:MAG: barstar family protein [Nitrosospira sp.]